MKYRLLLFLLIGFSIFSCRKDNLEYAKPLPNYLNVEYSENIDTVIIKKLIHSYSNESINLDLNGDDTTDASVFCLFGGSNGMGYYSDFYIKTLNPKVNFIGTLATDTIFYYTQIDTTPTPDFEGKIYVNQKEITTCESNFSNNTMVNSNPFKFIFKQFQLNEKIELKDTIFQYQIALTSESYMQNAQILNEVNDTVYTKRVIRNLNCYDLKDEVYVGFSIRNHLNETKLGWIHLFVDNSAIVVSETAIQNSN